MTAHFVARLYSRNARNRQKHIVDPERAFSHREPARRQPCLPSTDRGLSSHGAPRPRASSGGEQLHPAYSFLPGWHAHLELLWHFHSSGAGRRRPGGRCERMGHAEPKARARPRTRSTEKGGPARYLSKRVLSFDAAAHRRPRLHLCRHHARCKPPAPPGAKFARHSCHGDRGCGRGSQYLSLLWLCRSPRRRGRRKRDEHHSAAVFVSSSLHRRADYVEWGQRAHTFVHGSGSRICPISRSLRPRASRTENLPESLQSYVAVEL